MRTPQSATTSHVEATNGTDYYIEAVRQELIAKYGSCSAIPAEAWADYDARCAEWQERRNARL